MGGRAEGLGVDTAVLQSKIESPLMSDCLLRIGEAVAVNCGDLKGNRRLNHGFNSLFQTLAVRSSKTDQEGVGAKLYVTSDTRRIIKRYRKKAGVTVPPGQKEGSHPVSRLSARSARRQITYWAELAGVEGFISGHSLRSSEAKMKESLRSMRKLRVGSAVSLAQAGAFVED